MAVSQAANIGANFSDYQGSAALGGGSLGVAKIDTRPLEDLAKYTFLYNRSEYDQRQKDAEKAAAEIADYMSYDLVNGIPKFSKLLQDEHDELKKFAIDNPDALNYRDRKSWTEYQKLRGKLANNIKAAKENEIIFKVRQQEILDATLPEEKQRLQKDLDNEVASLDIRGRLKYSNKFDVKPVEVGAAPTFTRKTTEIGKNFSGDAEDVLIDMRLANNTAEGLANGLLKISEDKGKFGQQYEAAVTSGKLEPVLSSEYFNEAVQSYKDPKYLNPDGTHKYLNPDGTLNIDNIIASGDNIVTRNLMNIKAVNDRIRMEKSRIQRGDFMNDLGGELQFSNDPSGLTENLYTEIDINDPDGYSPKDIILTRMLAKTPIKPRTIKLDQTDLGIKKGNLSARWAEVNKPSSKAQVDGISTPAILFGEHIDRIKKSLNKYPQGLSVNFSAIDPGTQKALGILKGERVVYNPDGSYIIQTEEGAIGKTKTWVNKTIGTLEDLKQGFINVVKGGLSSDGTQTKEFQDESEKGFNSIFGTTSGSMIFNQWASAKQPEQKPQVVDGYEIPNGAKVVYSKKTGKALGYTLNGENYKF